MWGCLLDHTRRPLYSFRLVLPVVKSHPDDSTPETAEEAEEARQSVGMGSSGLDEELPLQNRPGDMYGVD